MYTTNKRLLFWGILFALQFNCQGQEEWIFNRLKAVKRDRSACTYLDTLTSDTLYENYKTGIRILKSKDNVILSRGAVGGGLGTRCGCEPSPHGMWVKRYRTGQLKEMGEYSCNQKAGTWTYFYENGMPQKIETYQTPYLGFLTEDDLRDSLGNWMYLRSGLYAEFYESGGLKTEGRYEIIEAFSPTDTLITYDVETTFEEIKTPIKGAFWRPKSIKMGVWREFSENGALLKIDDFKPPWITDNKYRPISSRYYELFSEEKK